MSENIIPKYDNPQEENLPEIIKSELSSLSELKEKKEEAKEKAEAAKSLADEMEKPKFLATKSAVENLHSVTKAFSDAQVTAAEAQEKSFEYQEKLATASKYLFALGTTNIAMNRAVVRELRNTLENSDSTEFIDEVQKELENVILQLIAQEDLMNKQEKFSDNLNSIDEQVKINSKAIDKNSERIAKSEKANYIQDKMIVSGVKKDREHYHLLEKNELIDSKQNKQLKELQKKDERQEKRLETLETEVSSTSTSIKKTITVRKHNVQIVIVGIIAILALILAIIGLVS